MKTAGASTTNWRYTWEAQSFSPTLRLFLFNSHYSPSKRCKELQVWLNPLQSLLLVAWFDEGDEEERGKEKVLLRVPFPRVLIDLESPINFRALDDHIEVKLTLLLPVNHPIVSGFDSVLNLSDNGGGKALDAASPLVLGSDLKSLLSMDGVHIYCRNCAQKLTKSPLRNISEAPSVNWRELADNWFGNCCCSFDGASEKLVAKYAKSYTCANGLCLLSLTSVILCKDDLKDCKFPDNGAPSRHPHEPNPLLPAMSKRNQEKSTDYCDRSGRPCSTSCNEVKRIDRLFCSKQMPDFLENESRIPCAHGQHVISDKAEEAINDVDTLRLLSDKKSLLNGFLEDVFMARASNLSKSVKWNQFVCPQCSTLLGAYPSGDDVEAPIDGGVRLFKCYISTSLPAGNLDDVFRKHSMETMFSSMLVENAKDELSFRIMVRDLTTRRPMIQVVLLNPNCWQSMGNCSGEDTPDEPSSKAELWPVAKVMFSDCSEELQPRVMESKIRNYLDDEVFIFESQAEELIHSLVAAHELVPKSCAYFQGLSVSSMRR